MDFFITGLPRSRTAWLANFFTTGPSYCAHDALLGCADLGAFAKRMESLPGSIRGDSDSGLALFAPALMARYPDARWAVVQRSPDEVAESLHRMPAYPGLERTTRSEAQAVVEMTQRHLYPLMSDLRTKLFTFESLGTATGLYAMWEWLLRGRVEWCPERAAMLQSMRVTVIPERALFDHAAVASLAREVA
jgi:hypothetical protein